MAGIDADEVKWLRVFCNQAAELVEGKPCADLDFGRGADGGDVVFKLFSQSTEFHVLMFDATLEAIDRHDRSFRRFAEVFEQPACRAPFNCQPGMLRLNQSWVKVGEIVFFDMIYMIFRIREVAYRNTSFQLTKYQ